MQKHQKLVGSKIQRQIIDQKGEGEGGGVGESP